MQTYFKVTLGYGLNFIGLYPIDEACPKLVGREYILPAEKYGKDW